MPSEPVPMDSRRAEYATRFNRVVDHIQAHLAEPMDLETLAGVACFSPYHFHRLFHGWRGETIRDFVFRLRVERAAAQLLYNPSKTITEIALDCGFSSSATFARGFRAFHGISATEFRKNRNTHRKNGKADPSLGVPCSGGLPERAFNMTLNVQVMQLEPMHVAYLRHVGPFQEDAALFERLLGRIRAWAGLRGLLGPEARLLSVSHDDPEITEARKLRLDVAITVPEGTGVGGEIVCRKLEGGPYAVARVRLLPSQFMEAWDTLMGGWLPGSGYQPDDRPRFEIYLDNPLTDAQGRLNVELCLAVRPLWC